MSCDCCDGYDGPVRSLATLGGRLPVGLKWSYLGETGPECHIWQAFGGATYFLRTKSGDPVTVAFNNGWRLYYESWAKG